MTTSTILVIFLLLQTKHFFVDFPLQRPFQWQNKGTYGHLGGIEHSMLHVLGTFLALVWFVPFEFALLLAWMDGLIHYHIDWWKMNMNKKRGYKADTHPQFWTLLGFDQYLHQLTYIGICLCLL